VQHAGRNSFVERKQKKGTTMNQPTQFRKTRTFSMALVLACFALLPSAPAADGGLPNQNTAEGTGALSSLTSGADNTAVGFQALYSLTDGLEDTAVGSSALANDTGGFNAAFGFAALFSNTSGQFNTAMGRNALFSNTTGIENTATGGAALFSNTTGFSNTATGRYALKLNATGQSNTATGRSSLFSNATGNNNTASGTFALHENNNGDNNTAEGFGALFNNTTGHGNIALGYLAGINLTTGSHNIDIGAQGAAGESDHIRIGRKEIHKDTFIAGISGTTIAGGVTVVIDTNGHLGTVTSSARFKDEIKPMDKASEAIFRLKPVMFHYKSELDPSSIPQFGLIAEEVEKVNPELVARDEEGKPYTVRYEAVNAMLLNEFLKEHRKGEQQDRKIEELEATVTKLDSALEAQASKIQKVSDQLAISKATPQLVVNNP
jgi:hypothetical protein